MDAIVRRITVVSSSPQGPAAKVVFERDSSPRKSSRLLKPVEKVQRRMLEAGRTLADETLALHEKYARKRKDGWLLDAPAIVFKANRRALKTLTKW